MSNSARKNRYQKIDKRIGHKQARQATRRVLEDGQVPGTVHGVHWSSTLEQPPLPDAASTGSTKSKRKGCKRNKYGPHLIRAVVAAPSWEFVFNPETKRFEHRAIPWTRRRYRPPYECVHCHKAFYRVPKDAERYAPITSKPEEIEIDDHYDDFNIKMRLLGLKCKCIECKR